MTFNPLFDSVEPTTAVPDVPPALPDDPRRRPVANAISAADGPFYVEASNAPPKPPYGSPERANYDAMSPETTPAPARIARFQVHLDPTSDRFLRDISTIAVVRHCTGKVTRSAVIRQALALLASRMTPEQIVEFLK